MFETTCKQCGAVNALGSRFCESCGSALSDASQAAPVRTPPPPVAAPPPNVPPAFPQTGGPVTRGSDQQGKAVASLVLGIAGFVACGPFSAIPGMILGKSVMNAVRDGRAPASDESLAKVGFYISLGVTILYGLLLILVLAFGLLPLILSSISSS